MFLIAVPTGPQNKAVRKASTADNGEPGTVRPVGEGVRRGELAWGGGDGEGVLAGQPPYRAMGF